MMCIVCIREAGPACPVLLFLPPNKMGNRQVFRLVERNP